MLNPLIRNPPAHTTAPSNCQRETHRSRLNQNKHHHIKAANESEKLMSADKYYITSN